MSKPDLKKRSRATTHSDDSDSGAPSRPKKSYSDGYDEHFRGNAVDRAWLQQLSEREREAELLKRHEERERLKHHEEISKRLEAKEKQSLSTGATTSKKVSETLFDNEIYAADNDDDDDDEDRPTSHRRQEVNASKQKDTQHSRVLQALVEERKKKQDGGVKKPLPRAPVANASSSDEEQTKKPSKVHKHKEKLNVDDVFSSSSSDEEDRRRSRSPTNPTKKRKSGQEDSRNKRTTPISDRAELKSMTLTRFRMEKWCHAPFFPKIVKGAFVRINIGQHNGLPVYRICEIRDVVETGKIYNLGSTRTNKGLRLKHGNHERVFRLEFVSNKEISDSEFKRWREAVLKQGNSLPNLEAMEKKIQEIDEGKQYVLKNTDITKIVQEKNRFRKTPINYAMRRNELLEEIALAQDGQDLRKKNELKRKLEEFEERASELDRKRTENISVMAQINQRNRKTTQANIEMALVREAQEHRTAAPNPFTRRRCAPTLVSKAPQTKEELLRELQVRRAADEAAAAAKKKAEEQRVSKTTVTPKKPMTPVVDFHLLGGGSFSSIPTSERGSFAMFSDHTDEMFTSHNFELDVKI